MQLIWEIESDIFVSSRGAGGSYQRMKVTGRVNGPSTNL